MIEPKPMLVYTFGFRLAFPREIRQQIVEEALSRISPDVDLIIFDPEYKESRYEDEGRTLILPINYPQKAYAKLDDYGREKLNKMGFRTSTRYVLTFLLPDEW